MTSSVSSRIARSLSLALLLPLATSSLQAVTFIVTTRTDAIPSPAGSLRRAIEQVNDGKADVIEFAVTDGSTISPIADLPAVTQPARIDGNTQLDPSGNPIINLDGKAALGRGLTITGGNSTVRGLMVTRFTTAGISLQVLGNNTITHCFIGTDTAGATLLGNAVGIEVKSSDDNEIGGTTAPARNIISGNDIGIDIMAGTGNIVEGNFIGTGGGGATILPNRDGIVLEGGAQDSVIGGLSPASRNVISGNDEVGVFIRGGGTSANQVQGNYIGLDVSGTLALPDRLAGVAIREGAFNNVIGGLSAANVISGNAHSGVFIGDAGTSGNSVFGNWIGTAADGTTALPNHLGGVTLALGAMNNQIGGTGFGEPNRIAHNGRAGVLLQGGATTGNSILGNSIFSNLGLGINLQPDGEAENLVTLNDTGDTDSGPNNLQNFPEDIVVTEAGGSTSISGRLQGAAGRSYDIAIYRSTSADPSGYGQGEVYLTTLTAVAGVDGNAYFSYSSSGSFPGQFFSATATDSLTHDTSEFSQAVPVGGGLEFQLAEYTVDEGAGSATITVVRSGSKAGAVSVHYSTSDGTDSSSPALAPGDYTSASGTLSFADGASIASFTVPIIDDLLDEADEYVDLTLDSPTGGAALGGRFHAHLKIVDNDPAPGISITDTDTYEPASGSVDATFTISLSGPTYQDVSVDCQTLNGTAHAGSDFDALPLTTLTFAPGETTKSVTVKIHGDGVKEGDEKYSVKLSNPVYATITKGIGNGTIHDPLSIVASPGSQSPMSFNLSFDTAQGGLYRIERTSNFGPNAQWSPLPGAEFIQGTGQTMIVPDQAAANLPRAFYRLMRLQ